MTDFTIQSGTSGTFTLNSGDTLTVAMGGLSSRSVVNSGSTETVQSLNGGLGDVINGGTEFVNGTATLDVISSGQVAVTDLLTSATQFGGATFVSGARLLASTLSGGSVFAYSGSLISAETVTGGTLNISSGGTALGSIIGAGGTEQIYASGSDNGGQLAGTQFVNSGGDVTGQMVLAGGTQTVGPNGSALGSMVAGAQVVSGGLVVGTTVNSGGVQTIATGSATSDTIMSGGSATIMTGGTVSGATISAGGELTLQGGTAIGTIANAGDVTFAFATSNTFTGALSGTGTVTVGGSATVVLAGTDTGTGATTIAFGGSLELTSAGAAGSGAIVFGTGTGTLIVDGAVPTNVISGVLPFGSDRILLNNLGSGSATVSQTNGDLVTVTAGGVTDTLNIAGSHADSFAGTTSGGSFVLTEQAACFLRGGMIAVPGGEVAVETLRAGDLVQLEGGRAVPVQWIGTGRGVITDANRSDLAPVIIRAGALADGMPCRDLRLTRRHGVRVGAALVPAELLVNDRSVVWDEAAGEVEIFHIQIDGHGILLADGAPAESFIDDGSAGLFANAAERPITAPTDPCLPRAVSGPALEQAWNQVAARVAPLPDVATTTDPDLHIEQDGTRIQAFAVEGGVYRFRMPRPHGDIVLRSRSVIPASVAGYGDARRLGVALTGLETGGVRHSPALLDSGVHAMEGGHRWTKGRAILPMALFEGAEGEVELAVHVTASLSYRAALATHHAG